MSPVLEGKLAIISGSSRGIGAATASNLASKGANLILTYNSDSSASRVTALAETLSTEYSVKVITIRVDMGDPSGPLYLVDEAAKHFDPLQIDILINNAAVGPQARIEETNIEDFHRAYAVNVLGPLLLMKAALPYLPNDRSGRIINVSSAGSTLGMKGRSIYGGTKAALEAMTRSWSREIAERATVNSVTPGPTRTELFTGLPDELYAGLKPFIQLAPLMAVREGIDTTDVIAEAKILGGRLGEAHEIAGVISMLCTPDSGWCTGQVISATGGMQFGLQ